MNKVLSLERNALPWLLVGAALLLPLPSGHPALLLASTPFATVRRKGLVMNYGTFEGFPAIWDDAVGFVLYGEDWRKVPIVELDQSAGLMTKAAFDAAFPRLPPLPKQLKA